MSVSLNEVVRLHCPAASRLSKQIWERPNSRLSSDLYLQLEDSSLTFIATPATLGHYLCLSTENGYQQTMAIYQVKQKSSPAPQTTTSHTLVQDLPTTPPRPGLHTSVEMWPKRTETMTTLSSSNIELTTRLLGRDLTTQTDQSGLKDAELWDEKFLLSARGPCYLKELVVVSVLLVLCLSLLLTVLLYVLRQRCRSPTAPEAPAPSRNGDRRTPVEQEALTGGQFMTKRRGHIQHNGHASGAVCNGAHTDSNGHLPNIPI